MKTQDPSKFAVLGSFTGECADATITNKNGLDITREVWETVFASDDYKQAIDLGWYIGYLGHPEDPNCMDFEHGCIVMKEGHINDDGKVIGSFDLIDTPVGKIVKTFIDAGVTFGISVRGAGDIVANSVEPDSFVFRGFDLVTFPAFPDAIPQFSEVAASSTIEEQQRYSKICAAVSDNIDSLNTIGAIDVIQSCFAKQSEPYKQLASKRAELESSEAVDDVEDINASDVESITAAQVKGLTALYVSEHRRNAELIAENRRLQNKLAAVTSTNDRKIRALKRIMSSQLAEMDKSIADVGALRSQAIRANRQLQQKNSELTRKQHQAEMASETALSQAKDKILATQQIIQDLKLELKEIKSSNLKYKQEIEAAKSELSANKRIVANMQTELKETVHTAQDAEALSSNLDAENKKLKAKIAASQALLEDYQNAYANLYANATGVHLNNVTITATTSVSDIRQTINKAASIASESQDTDGYIPVTDDEIYVDDGSLVVM